MENCASECGVFTQQQALDYLGGKVRELCVFISSVDVMVKAAKGAYLKTISSSKH
jgi:hypothetical protein